MKRLVTLSAAAILALTATPAVATWTFTSTGSGTAASTSVAQVQRATATQGEGEVVVEWAPSLLTSGDEVGGYRVVRHQGDNTTTVCTTTSPVVRCADPSPANGTVSYGVVATIGEHWSGPESDLVSFTHDSVAPVTTAKVSPTPNAGWNNTDVTVSFEAEDAGSGVKDVTFAGETKNGSTASKEITAEGTTTIPYFATDNAGNVEESKTVDVRIDRTHPTATISPGDSSDWHTVFTKPVTIEAVDDAGPAGGNSGVATVRYSIDGGPQTEAPAPVSFNLLEGDHSVSYSAVDVAGNEGPARTARIRVDNTDPFNLAISPAGSTAEWRTSAAISFGAQDAVSGVYAFLYRVNGVSRPNLHAPFSATLPDGTNTVTYQAVDNAGNITNAPLTATIKVDTVAPVTTLSQGSGNGQVTLGAADATSGVASIHYRTGESGTYTAATGPSVPLDLPNGEHSLWYYAVDNAGNQETPQSRTITVGSVDSAPPVIAFSDLVNGGSYTSQNAGNGSWAKVCGVGRICASVTDGGSGVNPATVSYTLTGLTGAQAGKCWNNGAWIAGVACVGTMTQSGSTWSATTLVSRNGAQGMNVGTYRVTVRAADNAGNADETTITFTTTN